MPFRENSIFWLAMATAEAFSTNGAIASPLSDPIAIPRVTVTWFADHNLSSSVRADLQASYFPENVSATFGYLQTFPMENCPPACGISAELVLSDPEPYMLPVRLSFFDR